MKQNKQQTSQKLSDIICLDGSCERVPIGMNGFGRFGLRLFRYWLSNKDRAGFDISFINEPHRSAQDIAENMKDDTVIGSIPHSVKVEGNTIRVDGHPIVVSSAKTIEDIPWHNDVKMVFECTGKFTDREKAAQHLRGSVKKVLISATSLSADMLIVLGVNHNEYDPSRHTIVSYGSCTINAYVPIAKVLNDAFGIEASHVHVIHNTPLRDIKKPFGEIARKGCTLEVVGPRLLPSLLNVFTVTYRHVPYPGASLMDMSFNLSKDVSPEEVVVMLKEASETSQDIHLDFAKEDTTSNDHISHPASAVIIPSEVRKVGKRVLLSAWFDNENSATRFFDFANFILKKDGNTNK